MLLDAGALSDAQLRGAAELLAHLNEASFGYRSGDLGRPLPGEPRPQFDPVCTTLRERLEAKAAELGCSVERLRKRRRALQRNGVAALVDGRAARSATGASRQTFNRMVDEVLAVTGLFRRPAKSRRSALPSEDLGSLVAERPGEFVAIDTTGLDVFAIDPFTFQWVGLDLTVALDVCTRSILAFRLTPFSNQGVDLALLLSDYGAHRARLRSWSGRRALGHEVRRGWRRVSGASAGRSRL